MNYEPVTDEGKVLAALMESWRKNAKIMKEIEMEAPDTEEEKIIRTRDLTKKGWYKKTG